MRRFKMLGDTRYTLETPARAEVRDLLCDQCGRDACSVRMIMKRIWHNRFGADLAVTRCASFVPVLEFRNGAGLDAPEFNTFRLGGAWAKRVVNGSIMRLNYPGGVRFARVKSVTTGPFSVMSKEFGIDNHLAIEASALGMEIDLEAVMTECYGKHRFNSSSTVAVIEMEGIDGGLEEG